jgi:3-hydroxyacyl-[acyl-carrier-protein] dehydratase
MKKQHAAEDDIRFSVREQVPHKDKMLLISGMAWKDGQTVKLSFPVPRDSVFVGPDARLAPVALVEMLAQLCGAQHTYDHGLRADELHGYLVGIDNVTFHGPVYAGDELTFSAWKTFDLQDIKRVKGEVNGRNGLTAVIELTLFESGGWIPRPQNPRPGATGAGSGTARAWEVPGQKDAIARGIMDSMTGVVTRPGGEVEARLNFAEEFVGFCGHFPDYPVLPAVLAIYSGWLLAEISRRRELELCSIRRAKFAAPILPGDEIAVSLKQTGAESGEGEWFSVSLKNQGQLAAKFMFQTRPAAGRARP